MPESKLKRYNLTRLGEEMEPRVYYRRDAHCPVITHVRKRGKDARVKISGWLINISEQGCLISADGFPPELADAYVIFPGLGSKVLGVITTQGAFTIQVQFEKEMPAGLVGQISRLTLQKGHSVGG